MSNEVYVHGLKELAEVLRTLPLKLQTNVMRSALRQGANVIKEQAKANVPASPPSTKNRKMYRGYEGALRDSLRVDTRSKRGVVTASIKAGGKSKNKIVDTYYAVWVEYGTSAHWINSKSGWLNINGRHVKAPVLHPGAKPTPFMRPAANSKKGDAVEVVGNRVKAALSTKHGLNVAHIEVEQG